MDDSDTIRAIHRLMKKRIRPEQRLGLMVRVVTSSTFLYARFVENPGLWVLMKICSRGKCPPLKHLTKAIRNEADSHTFATSLLHELELVLDHGQLDDGFVIEIERLAMPSRRLERFELQLCEDGDRLIKNHLGDQCAKRLDTAVESNTSLQSIMDSSPSLQKWRTGVRLAVFLPLARHWPADGSNLLYVDELENLVGSWRDFAKRRYCRDIEDICSCNVLDHDNDAEPQWRSCLLDIIERELDRSETSADLLLWYYALRDAPESRSFRVTAKRIRLRDFVEDVEVDSLLTLRRKLDRIRKCLDRNQSRHVQMTDEAGHTQPQTYAPENASTFLDEARQVLSDNDLFILRHVNEGTMAHNEIADALGLTPDEIVSMYEQASRRLQDLRRKFWKSKGVHRPRGL